MTDRTRLDPELVPGAHRVIRALGSGEGPFAGLLVRRADSVAVLSEAADYAGWQGWRFAGAEHLAGPLDVVRRADGHDVLLPWCTDQVSRFIARRASSGQQLSAGEVSTLIASLLRGVAELCSSEQGGLEGRWWLSSDGRPLWVIGEGDDPWNASSRIVAQIGVDCSDRALARTLGSIEQGLRDGAGRGQIPSRQLRRWEDELFAIAAPRPLAQDTSGPSRAADIDMARAVRETDHESLQLSRRQARVRRRSAVPPPLQAMMPLWRRVRAALQSAAARRPRRTSPGEPRRARSERGAGVVDRAAARTARQPGPPAGARRGRTLAFAGGAAILVLTIGLLWPSEGSEDASSGRGEPTPTTAASEDVEVVSATRNPRAGDTGRPVEADDATSADDPVVAAQGLIASLGGCASAGDLVCSAALAQGSQGVVERIEGISGRDVGPLIEIIDSYGDVAVVRATWGDAEGDEVMLVLARITEKWLIRDAYDVADQPG